MHIILNIGALFLFCLGIIILLKKVDKGRKVGDKNTPETFLKMSFS